MISDAMEQRAAARRARVQQDKKNPQLVNITNGRLMPNVKALREHPDYRVYDGPGGLTDAERLSFVKKGVGARRKIVNSAAGGIDPTKPFDVGTANKDELILFAADELGLMLDDSKDVDTLRAEVMKFAAASDEADSDLAG